MPARPPRRAPVSKLDWESRVRNLVSRKNAFNAALGLLLLVVAHVVALVVSKIAVHLANRYTSSAEQTQRAVAFSMVGSAVYWVIIAVVMLILPAWLGVETAALVAVLGSVLFAVGLGLQGTLADLAAGVMLVGANTFRINDYIEVPAINVKGTVHVFGILYTRVIDEDSGVTIIVPNRALYESAIINHSSTTRHVVVLSVMVSNRVARMRGVLDELRDKVQAFPGVLSDTGLQVACNIGAVSALGTTIEVRLAITAKDYQVSGTRNKQAVILTHIRDTLTSMGVPLVDIGGSTSGGTGAVVATWGDAMALP